jgi:hypothetical protein
MDTPLFNKEELVYAGLDDNAIKQKLVVLLACPLIIQVLEVYRVV